jgi:hypothetical protein
MDLSFIRTGGLIARGTGQAGRLAPTALPFLLAAAAAAQAASPTARALATNLRGQVGPEDWVQALARIFAPRANDIEAGMIEADNLKGSFNPLIARRSVVGAK